MVKRRTHKSTTKKFDFKAPTFTDMNCKKCDTFVYNVSAEAKSVTCGRCVQSNIPFPKHVTEIVKSDKPRGWAFMSQFVAKDGTVYFRGKEQPDLKGTLPITDAEAIKREQKTSSAEKKKAHSLRLTNRYKKKRLLQRSKDAKDQGNTKKARELTKKANAIRLNEARK